jgi:large subunit ribosomal protein L24
MPSIRKGDTVKVLAGKEKGKQGKVLEVLLEKGRVRVEKLMTVKRHLKKGRSQSTPEGGILEKDGTIAISSVAVVGASGKPGRREKIGRDLGAKEKARAEKRKAAAAK